MATPQKRCTICGGPPPEGERLKRCGICKTKSYCSKECQNSDWPTHKKLCAPIDPKVQRKYFNMESYVMRNTESLILLTKTANKEEYKDRYYVVPIAHSKLPPRHCIPIKFTDVPSRTPLPPEYKDWDLSFLDEKHELRCEDFRAGVQGIHIIAFDNRIIDDGVRTLSTTMRIVPKSEVPQ